MTGAVRFRSRRNGGRRREPLVILVGIAILAAVVLVCAALLAVPLWTALVGNWRFEPIPDQCEMIKDARAREACDEKRRVEGPQHPAKGANAPIRLRAPEQRSD
ncbi:MAG TPA: hypothetical protein VH934_05795 [Xanthobacteraceae bacterium]|jgi:hypothetical protein